MHCRKETVGIANYVTYIFNEDFYLILQIMSIVNINIRQQVKMFADFRDKKRIQQSEYILASKEARTARRLDNVFK